MCFLQEAYFTTGTSNQTVTDTGGVARANIVGNNADTQGQAMPTQAAAGDNTYGIQAGTGNAANTASTSGLSTLIANGGGASQLNYGSMGFTLPAGSAPESMTFTRTLNNVSGGTINITELGLVVHAAPNSGPFNFMIIRDVVSAISVLNGANTTITGTMQYTIS